MLARTKGLKILGSALVFAGALGTAQPAHAGIFSWLSWLFRPRPANPGYTPRTDPVHTPEIDPGMLRGSLVLLGGGLLALTDRKRRS
jgi:hypothetical protein